jgi:hypothetical protein
MRLRASLASPGNAVWSAPCRAGDQGELFINRYQGGVDNYLQVITAQTITLTNERTEIDILRRRMDASVLLVKALGGGWTTSNLPAMTGRLTDPGKSRRVNRSLTVAAR